MLLLFLQKENEFCLSYEAAPKASGITPVLGPRVESPSGGLYAVVFSINDWDMERSCVCV